MYHNSVYGRNRKYLQHFFGSFNITKHTLSQHKGKLTIICSSDNINLLEKYTTISRNFNLN